MITNYPQLFRHVLMTLSAITFTLSIKIAQAQSGCTGPIPAGYESIFCADMETSETVRDYLPSGTWYFYADSNTPGNVSGGENNDRFHDRFTVVTDPIDPNNRVMRQTLFGGDMPYQGGNNPSRTEISTRNFLTIDASKEIYFKIRTYFPSTQFAAEFIQFWVHASPSIPHQIEIREGKFGARLPRDGGYSHKSFPGKLLSDYSGKWITWEVRAKFTKSNGGYYYIYMDGEKVFEDTFSQAIWADDDEDFHTQFGVYSGSSIGTQIAYFDDFVLAEHTGIIIPDETEITALELIDAINESPISGYEDLSNITYIQESELSTTDFNVYANTIGDVDSVTFSFDLNGDIGTRKESNAPYAMKGDGISYEPWDLNLGTYSITANAYHEGTIKSTATANFEVVEFFPEFHPIHDAYVQGTDGHNTSDLRVESGNRTTFLKFDLTNVTGTITSAQLELVVSTDGGNGPIVIYETSTSNWEESTINSTSAPTVGLELGSLSGDFTIGNTYLWDLDDVYGGGLITLAIQHHGSNDVSFSSKEGSVKPKLTLTVDDGIVTSNTHTFDEQGVISFSPNPSNGQINIHGILNGASYTIYDLSGLVVDSGILESQSLDLSHFDNGLYLIETTDGNSINTNRLIIQN